MLHFAFDDLIQAVARDGAGIGAYQRALERGGERIRQHCHHRDSSWRAIAARSTLVDHILMHCWRALVDDRHCALVAVGGYGRGALYPYSDVDLMILTGARLGADEQSIIGEFIARLWDLGLDIGHSVRTIEECVDQSRRDLTVITNLMETRLLCGSSDLYQAMLRSIRPDKIWSAADFFRAKREEQRKRHRCFQDTSYRLEPNVKESPGGIRDIQTVRWIAQRYFGTGDFQALVRRGFLAPDELVTLQEGEDLLCKIRFLLHNIAGRREDRLLFDHQRELAHAFDFDNDDNNQCIEAFMQNYYRAVMALERLNEMLLQLFAESLPEQRAKNRIVPLNDRFQINDRYIEAIGDDVFKQHPPALLELFLLSARNPRIRGVCADTIRLVRSHLCLIDARFRDDPVCRELFMDILRQPQGVTHQLRSMNRHGVLAAYLPAFERIVGRMQYDMFHVFTVDEHTLMVIRNLRRFSLDKHRDELPHCHRVMASIDKPELLLLMGLFHDIGKGRGGDHSALGASVAREFCTTHGLDEIDTDLVEWAVAKHLLMSMTMQRRDVSDPEVIHGFAERVGSVRRLDYLYLLTVADIRGTSPELWNSWKDSLLQTLYRGAHDVLNRDRDTPLNGAAIITENKARALVLLANSGIDEASILALWEELGDEYFLRYQADEVSWHTPAILGRDPAATALVLVRKDERYGSTEIFVYCRDQRYLFTQITAVIGQLGLNIISARIVTSNTTYALDRFRVLDKNGHPVTDPCQLRKIRSAIESALNRPEVLPRDESRRQSRRLQNFYVPVHIEFDNSVTEGLTSVAVTATDRPGALSRIARGFLDCGVTVHAAKVATFGEKLEDVFFISDGNGLPVAKEEQLAQLKQTLERQLCT